MKAARLSIIGAITVMWKELRTGSRPLVHVQVASAKHRALLTSCWLRVALLPRIKQVC